MAGYGWNYQMIQQIGVSETTFAGTKVFQGNFSMVLLLSWDSNLVIVEF